MEKENKDKETEQTPCQSELKDGLSVLLQDAKDQLGWFEENSNEKGISGETKHYRIGSRDAYSYMVSAILEVINR